jgi:hypothetical protein
MRLENEVAMAIGMVVVEDHVGLQKSLPLMPP